MLLSSGRTHAASLADRAFQYSLRSDVLLPRVRQACRLHQKQATMRMKIAAADASPVADPGTVKRAQARPRSLGRHRRRR